MSLANYTLKDEIAAYWTERSATFDEDVAHRIPDGPVAEAWKALIRAGLGDLHGQRVLDLGCGTGEITRMLRALGAEVTGLDLSEAMLARARAKNGGPHHRAFLGDAESLPDRDATYDAVVTRHLVWTLPDAPAAFAEWHRVLRPGGRLLIVDGDFVSYTAIGRLKRAIAARLAPAPSRPGADTAARIQSQVHYSAGLRPDALRADLARAGFAGFRDHPVGALYRIMLRDASLATRLRLSAPVRFAISAARPTD
ncbi:class I SAM-dependent methyltransferase [Roseomonas sp. CCTCC AB2023176]|uniref:class I SAM-dependent methyltransferase n=1 Tax=Roseomonas sp. CCTCC AB2023176 TaxID=3342640 RepID=UPI0035DD0675